MLTPAMAAGGVLILCSIRLGGLDAVIIDGDIEVSVCIASQDSEVPHQFKLIIAVCKTPGKLCNSKNRAGDFYCISHSNHVHFASNNLHWKALKQGNLNIYML